MALTDYQKSRLAYINNDRPLPQKKVYQIPKVSVKRAEKEKQQQKTIIVKPKKAGFFDASLIDGSEIKAVSVREMPLDLWFIDRRKEMRGVCDNCGQKTCKDDDKYYKFSIAHLLPKAYVKSVATHPSNFLELCHFGNGCHNALDTHMIDLTEMACWDKIVERFVAMYPSIAPNEKRRIPESLLQYLEVEK